MKKSNPGKKGPPGDHGQPLPQPDKAGWVRRFCGRGIFRELWRNRYLLLRGTHLYISDKEMKEDQKNKSREVFDLADYDRSEELRKSGSRSKKNHSRFTLLRARVPGNKAPTLVFLAVSPEEKESWLNVLNAAILKARNRALDEVTIETAAALLHPTRDRVRIPHSRRLPTRAHLLAVASTSCHGMLTLDLVAEEDGFCSEYLGHFEDEEEEEDHWDLKTNMEGDCGLGSGSGLGLDLDSSSSSISKCVAVRQRANTDLCKNRAVSRETKVKTGSLPRGSERGWDTQTQTHTHTDTQMHVDNAKHLEVAKHSHLERTKVHKSQQLQAQCRTPQPGKRFSVLGRSRCASMDEVLNNRPAMIRSELRSALRRATTEEEAVDRGGGGEGGGRGGGGGGGGGDKGGGAYPANNNKGGVASVQPVGQLQSLIAQRMQRAQELLEEMRLQELQKARAERERAGGSCQFVKSIDSPRLHHLRGSESPHSSRSSLSPRSRSSDSPRLKAKDSPRLKLKEMKDSSSSFSSSSSPRLKHKESPKSRSKNKSRNRANDSPRSRTHSPSTHSPSSPSSSSSPSSNSNNNHAANSHAQNALAYDAKANPRTQNAHNNNKDAACFSAQNAKPNTAHTCAQNALANDGKASNNNTFAAISSAQNAISNDSKGNTSYSSSQNAIANDSLQRKHSPSSSSSSSSAASNNKNAAIANINAACSNTQTHTHTQNAASVGSSAQNAISLANNNATTPTNPDSEPQSRTHSDTHNNHVAKDATATSTSSSSSSPAANNNNHRNAKASSSPRRKHSSHSHSHSPSHSHPHPHPHSPRLTVTTVIRSPKIKPSSSSSTGSFTEDSPLRKSTDSAQASDGCESPCGSQTSNSPGLRTSLHKHSSSSGSFDSSSPPPSSSSSSFLLLQNTNTPSEKHIVDHLPSPLTLSEDDLQLMEEGEEEEEDEEEEKRRENEHMAGEKRRENVEQDLEAELNRTEAERLLKEAVCSWKEAQEVLQEVKQLQSQTLRRQRRRTYEKMALTAVRGGAKATADPSPPATTAADQSPPATTTTDAEGDGDNTPSEGAAESKTP